jgi:hypothetical protein
MLHVLALIVPPLVQIIGAEDVVALRHHHTKCSVTRLRFILERSALS